MAEWKTVRANIDYHVEIDRHYYSVPYQLAGQQLEARYTATAIELFQDAKRIASHMRSSVAYKHTTVHEHMPKSHQAHLQWTPSRLMHWGETAGTATAEVIRTILASKPHPEMGYRACLGIRRAWPRPIPISGSKPPGARAADAGLLLFQFALHPEALARQADDA